MEEWEYLSSVLLVCLFLSCHRILIPWVHTFHANLLHSVSLRPLCGVWDTPCSGCDAIKDRRSLGMLELSMLRRKTRSFPRASHTIILCTMIFISDIYLINEQYIFVLSPI